MSNQVSNPCGGKSTLQISQNVQRHFSIVRMDLMKELAHAETEDVWPKIV